MKGVKTEDNLFKITMQKKDPELWKNLLTPSLPISTSQVTCFMLRSKENTNSNTEETKISIGRPSPPTQKSNHEDLSDNLEATPRRKRSTIRISSRSSKVISAKRPTLPIAGS
jgi:hypothetical protein